MSSSKKLSDKFSPFTNSSDDSNMLDHEIDHEKFFSRFTCSEDSLLFSLPNSSGDRFIAKRRLFAESAQNFEKKTFVMKPETLGESSDQQ